MEHLIFLYSRFTADFASLREQFSRAKRLEELELLAAQVLYLLGLLLFMLDFKFPGSVRERIFVALYRQRYESSIRQNGPKLRFFPKFFLE